MNSSEVTEKVYEYITEETDNSCEDIPESACREAPGNFFLNAANGTLTKLAEAVASPGLVLPWLLASAGAPASSFYPGRSLSWIHCRCSRPADTDNGIGLHHFVWNSIIINITVIIRHAET